MHNGTNYLNAHFIQYILLYPHFEGKAEEGWRRWKPQKPTWTSLCWLCQVIVPWSLFLVRLWWGGLFSGMSCICTVITHDHDVLSAGWCFVYSCWFLYYCWFICSSSITEQEVGKWIWMFPMKCCIFQQGPISEVLHCAAALRRNPSPCGTWPEETPLSRWTAGPKVLYVMGHYTAMGCCSSSLQCSLVHSDFAIKWRKNVLQVTKPGIQSITKEALFIF